MLVCLVSGRDEHVVRTDGTVDRWASGRDDTSSRRLTGNLKSSIFFTVQSLLKMLCQVESLFTASLHISDFVQTQNEAKILTCRMMTMGWFFSPVWMVTSLQLILISSARSLGYPCFSSLPAYTMSYSCLCLWMIFESSFRLCLRVRSVPLPSGLVPYLPYTACLPRLSSTISGRCKAQ